MGSQENINQKISRTTSGEPEEFRFEFLENPMRFHRKKILDLFQEEDFYFCTSDPVLLSEGKIESLVNVNALGIKLNSEFIGLSKIVPLVSEKTGHYRIYLRLGSRVPVRLDPIVLEKIVRRVRMSSDVVRISMWVGDYDLRGLNMVRMNSFTEEGVMRNGTRHNGAWHGDHSFSLVWPPKEEIR